MKKTKIYEQVKSLFEEGEENLKSLKVAYFDSEMRDYLLMGTNRAEELTSEINGLLETISHDDATDIVDKLGEEFGFSPFEDDTWIFSDTYFFDWSGDGNYMRLKNCTPEAIKHAIEAYEADCIAKLEDDWDYELSFDRDEPSGSLKAKAREFANDLAHLVNAYNEKADDEMNYINFKFGSFSTADED